MLLLFCCIKEAVTISLTCQKMSIFANVHSCVNVYVQGIGLAFTLKIGCN